MQDTYHEVLALAQEAGISLILIGGHAVNALGYERTTLDLDFLILGDDLPQWQFLLSNAGYMLLRKSPAFAQFAPPDSSGFRVDLMMVDRQTFSKIESASQWVRYGHCDIRIPSVLHLIAMKLHALKNPDRSAIGKDYGDILALIFKHKLDIVSPEFQSLLDRYATPEIRKKLQRDCCECL